MQYVGRPAGNLRPPSPSSLECRWLSGTLLRKPSVKVVDVDESRQGYPAFFPSFQIFILGLWLCCLPGFSTNFSADKKPQAPWNPTSEVNLHPNS